MNAEDLLILGAIGAAVYYVMNQSTSVAAASASVQSPAATQPLAAAPTPSINIQPSTAPLSNPIASLAPAATPMLPLAPSPGPAPAPPVPVMAIPPPPTGITYTIQPSPLPAPTSSGPTPPTPTVQPGIVATPPAPPATIQVAPTPYIPPPVTVYNPVFGYQLSRFGTTLYPGDTWTATITGAKPGATVATMLSQNGGPAVNNTMGYVNSGGNFSYTGTVNPGADGQWTQLWFVNGSMIGSLGFTVVDPVVNAVMPTTTYNANIPNTPIGTPANPTQGPVIIGGVVYQTPLYI